MPSKKEVQRVSKLSRRFVEHLGERGNSKQIVNDKKKEEIGERSKIWRCSEVQGKKKREGGDHAMKM
jgi:hypothetical protein